MQHDDVNHALCASLRGAAATKMLGECRVSEARGISRFPLKFRGSGRQALLFLAFLRLDSKQVLRIFLGCDQPRCSISLSQHKRNLTSLSI